MIPDLCVRVLLPQSLKIRTKNTFSQNSRYSVCLRIGDLKRKVYLRNGDRKRNWFSNMGTGKENVSQKWGPENKLVLKSGDRKDFFRSQLLRLKLFSGPYFWDTFSFPVPIFESNFLFRAPILRYTFLFSSPILRYTLSLEFGEKCV